MVPTPPRLKVATNYHEGRFPKSELIVQAHSYHELLFYGLLSGRPDVVRFEHQPAAIKSAQGKQYVPDVRYETPTKVRFCEVKSEAGWNAARKRIEPLIMEYCQKHGAEFEFVSHEAIDAQRDLARAWLEITRWVAQYRDEPLERSRSLVNRVVRDTGRIALGDVFSHCRSVDAGSLMASICCLLHEHLIAANLAKGLWPGLMLEAA